MSRSCSEEQASHARDLCTEHMSKCQEHVTFDKARQLTREAAAKVKADFMEPVVVPKHTRFLQGTLPTAHGDYTARSGITRARQLLAPFVEEKDIDEVLKSRFAILNFW